MGFDLLFAQPSWISGLARTLDVAGQFDEYNESENGDIADAKAWFSDWRTVGESLADAMKTFRREAQEPVDTTAR